MFFNQSFCIIFVLGAELFVTLVTLLISLFFTVEIGLLAGICANIIHLALMWSRPKLKIELIKVRDYSFYKYNIVYNKYICILYFNAFNNSLKELSSY